MSDWLPLTVATCNAGNMSVKDAQKVAKAADAVCWQEMGDQSDIKTHLRGVRLYEGEGRPGQASTPITYDPEVLQPIHPLCIPLLGAIWWGPGTGPSRAKPKSLVGQMFRHLPTGRRVAIFSTHLPPTQGAPLRRKAAQTMSRGIVDSLRPLTSVALVGMDANAEPGKAGLAPLEDNGWTWSQAVDPIPTHGKRGIDGVWWRANDHRLKYAGTSTIHTGSDHLAAVVSFQLRKKR